jgi:hypothetical protein
MKKKNIWVQEKGCGNSFGHKNKPKKNWALGGK